MVFDHKLDLWDAKVHCEEPGAILAPSKTGGMIDELFGLKFADQNDNEKFPLRCPVKSSNDGPFKYLDG